MVKSYITTVVSGAKIYHYRVRILRDKNTGVRRFHLVAGRELCTPEFFNVLRSVIPNVLARDAISEDRFCRGVIVTPRQRVGGIGHLWLNLLDLVNVEGAVVDFAVGGKRT